MILNLLFDNKEKHALGHCMARTGNGDVFKGKKEGWSLNPWEKGERRRGCSSYWYWKGLGMGVGHGAQFLQWLKNQSLNH